MAKRCPKCVGQKWCTCPKDRPKDRPPEPFRSPRRERVRAHQWSPWVRARRDAAVRGEPSEPTDILVKICSVCGRARVRRKPL